MDRIVGGVLGLAALIAVLVLGLARGMGVWDTLWRGVVAAALGYLVGWMVFGRIGVDLAKESASVTEPAAPPAPKPPEPAPPK